MSLLSFFAISATALTAIKIALAAVAFLCVVFLIVVVMKQKGNTDGMEAMSGSSSKSDDSETFYGKNAGSRKEARLKILTYVAAGLAAVCCIVLMILVLIG